MMALSRDLEKRRFSWPLRIIGLFLMPLVLVGFLAMLLVDYLSFKCSKP